MRLSFLLRALPSVRLPSAGLDAEIRSVVTDSRRASGTSLFVCLRGPCDDGHTYARDAWARGCRSFVCEYDPGLSPGACVAYVADTSRALGYLASAFYGYPEHVLTLIGVTGTKGKSTTAMMIRHLLLSRGVAAGYIGSGGILYAGRREKTENTTPGALELRAALSRMKEAGIRAVVVEVSSQALTCGRVSGLDFPVSVFTNLAEDHIGTGEHPDYAHYRAAKSRLFSDYGCRAMVVNAADPATPFMVGGSSAARVVGFSATDPTADYTATRARPVRIGHTFATSAFFHAPGERDIPVTLPLPGLCNIENALAACAAVSEYFRYTAAPHPPSCRLLAAALADVRVPGRFEPVPLSFTPGDVLIDYAHNGYSLSSAIAALRAYGPERIVVLFGSVGGRTYSRRAELGRAACAADFCVVTVDDPDTEPPEDTMREIVRVLEDAGREYVTIPDRTAAIRYAVRHAREGDILLLAGKGHEDFQLIGGRRVPFSEKEILRAADAAFAPVP